MPLNSFPGRRAGKSASSASSRAVPVPVPAALEPTDAELLLHRARNAAYTEASQGHLGRGLMLLQDALDQEPMSHDLLSDMAALLLSAGQYDRAVSYAQRALQHISHHGPSLYTLGFALAAQGQIVPAIEVLTRLTRGGPSESLMAEAPMLMPLVETELERLKRLVD
ncbi:tetratricopeptide repeat protein [Pelomonas sp. KK5]|uniref:tetratricopeptide repeat protein n=1 Tax=Pelomonas sp. KK5 TaxID=1855730 RepID=UPI00117D52B2|nr:tetratricopeptide repeat protein [Pelomonas sp. KK5]